MRGNTMITGAVWRFHIDRGVGNTQVPVEMRGRTFNGIIKDGDHVQAPGPWRHGEILRPPYVINTRDKVRVEPVGWMTFDQWAQVALVGAIALAIFIAVAFFGWRFWSNGSDDFDQFKQTVEAQRAGFGETDNLQWLLDTCLDTAQSEAEKEWCRASVPDR